MSCTGRTDGQLVIRCIHTILNHTRHAPLICLTGHTNQLRALSADDPEAEGVDEDDTKSDWGVVESLGIDGIELRKAINVKEIQGVETTEGLQ